MEVLMKRIIVIKNPNRIKLKEEYIDKCIDDMLKTNNIVISEARTITSILEKRNYSRSISVRDFKNILKDNV